MASFGRETLMCSLRPSTANGHKSAHRAKPSLTHEAYYLVDSVNERECISGCRALRVASVADWILVIIRESAAQQCEFSRHRDVDWGLGAMVPAQLVQILILK